MPRRVVIALGGNAILKPHQSATVETQIANIRSSAEQIIKLEKLDHQIVVTHGNGPQVGNILRQNEEAKEVVPPFPLDVCNAESQGFIGYLMEQSIKNEIEQEELTCSVVTLLTQVEVSLEDPAFQEPSKPIGLFYDEAEAMTLAKEKNWIMQEDAGRGYRRVVPSPQPIAIHGVEAIVHLLNQNTIVIAGGGGGIPVIKEETGLRGIEAVIDKDRTGKKLAEQIDADVFMMLTDVSNVYIHYGTPQQEKLTELSVDEAEGYFDAGHFAEGSMGPKMEAAIGFAKQGKTAIICSLEEADLALSGQAGTRIVG
ncbi:carbamate kinase [Enterococcus sp.]|uniref:carbamate kinase n=1 Tax=Enterococcus sp. TaxID=35783 RepID=UPI0025C2F3E3|nr:carbamate kinase [Enterococcus sp.]